ncbi:MAG: penicillin-binding protein 1A [Rhodovibrionaceae bacterium]|nr:penicillin-binding protein 1A [Rhodovibrionaceae bacterium]
MSRLVKWLAGGLALVLLLAVIGGVGALVTINHYGKELPDYSQLAEYDPATVTRVHAGDGRLLAEYAIEKRVFVPIESIPGRVIDAFLSAEDKTFYDHPGVDFTGIARAAVTNLKNLGQDRRPVGASTITQQVAKNFLLSNEVSIERKLKEAILAFRIERAFSKDRILELYLNEIYLGFGSYGVAAAALNYFNKSLDELTLAEAAYLAALPKAPNNYHPIRRREEAIARRDWVIGRMLEDGRIARAQAEEAWVEELTISKRDPAQVTRADYFAEEVRRELMKLYGETKLYEGGLSVRTTIDPHLQDIAEQALRDGLEAYDRRHGWRGPIAGIDVSAGDWAERLAALEIESLREYWRRAVVLEVGAETATIGLDDGSQGQIPMIFLTWARPWLEGEKVGAQPSKPGDVLSVGDVIAVEPIAENDDGEPYPEGTYALQQIPKINGAIVAMDPHTGRVLAMSGGWSYAESEFNRATQAARQPGSAFKPFVYLTALDSGFTPNTLILDAPFVIDQGEGLGKWKPHNYARRFYGPTPMRVGIEKSRNLMTVRLAQAVGMEKISDTAERFGIVDHMPEVLSMALGAGETTLMRLTNGYAMLVNGGKKIEPALIDRVQDKHGRTVFRNDERDCPRCRVEAWEDQEVPRLPDTRPQIVAPTTAYQVVSMLQGVIERGTGRRIAELGRPLAGKTGTTNESQDTWFMGFSPDLVAGVFVGFDEPKPLGNRETGSSVAAPIFKAFMAEALKDEPLVPFRIPPGLKLMRVDLDSGRLAQPGDDHVILEAFKPGSDPNSGRGRVIDGGYTPDGGGGLGPDAQSGGSPSGLY